MQTSFTSETFCWLFAKTVKRHKLICDVLGDLVAFAQFKKRKKHPSVKLFDLPESMS